MKKAMRKNSAHVLLFMDASHFVLGCDFLGGVYAKVRKFIRTFSGRQRYNVLGAINFITKQVHTVTNTTYITATEICEMLQNIAQLYPDKYIHIVLDNAKYQRCDVVTDLAVKLGIDLVYLPPYSPNLNLIERFWKFTKNKLRVKYYNDFGSFKATIDEIIGGAGGIYRDKVASLIGEKVQLYDNLKPICENIFSSTKSAQKQAA